MARSAANTCFRVYQEYQHLLLIRSDYPLSPIYSSKNLAKKISRDQERDDKVNLVGPGKELAILGKIAVRLDSFGVLYKKLLEEVNEMQEGLFGGIGFEDEEWLSLKLPENLVDLVNSNHPGYCFGEDERNGLKKYENLGLKILFHHPRFKDRYGCMVSQDKFIPNTVACHEFLRLSELSTTKVAVATHISIGGPWRGTECMTHFLRNHPQGDIRNVKIVDGDICLVAGYNKSSSAVSLSPLPSLSSSVADSKSRPGNRRRYSDSSPRASTGPRSLTGLLSGRFKSSLLEFLVLIQRWRTLGIGSTPESSNHSLRKNYHGA